MSLEIKVEIKDRFKKLNFILKLENMSSIIIDLIIKTLLMIGGILLSGVGFALAMKNRRTSDLILSFILFSIGLFIIMVSLGFWIIR